MRASALRCALLIGLFLGVQSTVRYVSSNWTYRCSYPPCIFTLWFTEQLLESFRSCLCSASTASCIVDYLYHPGYTYINTHYDGYYEVNLIRPSYIHGESQERLPKFTCTLVFYNNFSGGYLQCNRSSNLSEGEYEYVQMYTEAQECSFKCIDLIKSTIYGTSFVYNDIINNVYSSEMCSHSTRFTSFTTPESTSARQANTREEPPTTTPNATTPILSTVTTKTESPDFNVSLTNKSELQDSEHDRHDDSTDVMLIAGIITPVVSVIVIAVVILLLRRRRIKTINQRKLKCESPSKENNFPDCNSKPENFPDNNVIRQGNTEVNRNIREGGCPLQDIDNESAVVYSTVKKKSERQIGVVSTPMKQDVDTKHQLDNINNINNVNIIDSITSNDYTEVDITPQYCYVTCDISHTPHTPDVTSEHINQETELESVYENAEKSPQGRVESNYLNVNPSYQSDRPTAVENIVLDDGSPASNSNGAVHTTMDVYAKLGGQSRDMTNPYNILPDQSDRKASVCAQQNAS